MECNECGKETDSIMVICPECDGKKDEQITALQAQLKDAHAQHDRLLGKFAKQQAQLKDREEALKKTEQLWQYWQTRALKAERKHQVHDVDEYYPNNEDKGEI